MAYRPAALHDAVNLKIVQLMIAPMIGSLLLVVAL
jgi:hypothetical protein